MAACWRLSSYLDECRNSRHLPRLEHKFKCTYHRGLGVKPKCETESLYDIGSMP
ncbi:hypothetical protein FQN50_005961, partial [Emmonsiellopsis sp. PD_5]